jgi:hypothetical protein
MNATFLPRTVRLAKEFADQKYRDTFVAHQIATSIANQIRALRGDTLQIQFGRKLGKPQSVVSRLEDEGYGRVSVQTLIDIAQKLDIALIIRFVNHQSFLRLTNDFSTSGLAPESYNQAAMDAFAKEEMAKVNLDASKAFADRETEEFKQPLRARLPESGNPTPQDVMRVGAEA